MLPHQAFLQELLNLETTLKKFKCWGPDEAEFNVSDVSTPFGIGSIHLMPWLQYLYIPKMRTIADSNAPLPVAEVTPYAEQVLVGEPCVAEVLLVLRRLDAMTKGNA